MSEHNKDNPLNQSTNHDTDGPTKDSDCARIPVTQIHHQTLASNQSELSPGLSCLFSPSSSERKQGHHLVVPHPLHVRIEKGKGLFQEADVNNNNSM